MSFPVPVLTGFAGVLVAAVATGVLAGRCVRQPRIGFIVWAGAALALTIALAAQSVGLARGFGPATFRAVQLFGLLLAPLWLAWGLVELVAANEAARFGMRLVSGALTVLGSVVLVTDPLTAQPFSKAWPLSGPYYQPISHDVLGAVQAVAVLAAVASVALAAVRARRDPAWRSAMAAVVSVGAAVLLTAGLRFPLPARAAYPLVSTLAAALVWFGASRLREHPATRRDGRDDGNLSAVSGVITPETADKLPSSLPSRLVAGCSLRRLAPNQTSAAANVLTSGYAALAGSGKRNPAVSSTAAPTETTAAIADRHAGSRLARTAARATLATAARTATACTAPSTSCEIGW